VRRTKELLEMIEMGDFENRWPQAMSGGQRQRVALVRALASEPRLLLLDEPFGALDPRIRGELRREVRSLIRRIGITAIFVTHDQEEAWEISDYVAVFNKCALLLSVLWTGVCSGRDSLPIREP
jgi:ABC-type sulfate/molybdate transport systems ATPase subunit